MNDYNMDSEYVTADEYIRPTQLDRIEAKLDTLLAGQAEVMAWKAELEEALQAFQSGGMMSIMGKMFGK